jgi:dihydrofolate reductase
MRRVRYSVAASLDGYIAGPNGEFDWIIHEPSIDFAALFRQFDTFLMGRRTFEVARGRGPSGGMPGMKVYVFSRTLRAEDYPDVTIVADDAGAAVEAIRREPGKDIWLFGGGELFRSLLEAGQVDAVEISIVPVLLGGGIPLLPAPSARTRLDLTHTHTYPSGIISLSYAVRKETPQGPAPTKSRGRARAAKSRKSR